jgi:hypothetical protein
MQWENMKKILVFILSGILICLAACSAGGPQATVTPVPTETSVPTATLEPTPTSTPEPSPTEVPTAEATALVAMPTPSGKPVSTWEGIPIMPEALAGESGSGSYSFTVRATPEEVQQFYETSLQKLGWSFFAAGKGTTETVLLMFTKGADIITLSAFPQPEGIMYVMLVK